MGNLVFVFSYVTSFHLRHPHHLAALDRGFFGGVGQSVFVDVGKPTPHLLIVKQGVDGFHAAEVVVTATVQVDVDDVVRAWHDVQFYIRCSTKP